MRSGQRMSVERSNGDPVNIRLGNVALGSRLKPGYAESAIVNGLLELTQETAK